MNRVLLKSIRLTKYWILLVSVVCISCFAQLKPEWDSIYQYIEQKYPTVAHITVSEALALPKDSVVFIDVRDAREYEVSHIPGALFYTDKSQIKNEIHAGKKVIIYCSVGVRSARLIYRLGYIKNSGVYNLKGSIFKWIEQERTLENTQGTTEMVHPFNAEWGRLLLDSLHQY